MVRYDGLLNAFHSLNFSRLTEPTILHYLRRVSPVEASVRLLQK